LSTWYGPHILGNLATRLKQRLWDMHTRLAAHITTDACPLLSVCSCGQALTTGQQDNLLQGDFL
jgi:hypothetical protein